MSAIVEPFAQVLRYREHPEGEYMEFRLVYYGPLPSESGRGGKTEDKQAIRKFLHPQLKQWWEQNQRRLGNAEVIAQNFDQYGFRFVPVVSKSKSENCSLEILFLRRDAPGNLIRSGGDVDNRIKVLFDGLRMPQEHREVGGAVPGEGENPFFCLLEDDTLITEVHIVTDRLLLPINEGESRHREHDVELIIHVKTDQDIARASDVDEAKGLAMRAGYRSAWGPTY